MYSDVCSYSEGFPIAQEMWERGYNCFVLYYRVFPRAYMPNPIEDVARAMKYIIENYSELYISDYLLMGFSAGGHLAGIWATKQGYPRYNLPKPKFLSLTYPVIDLSLKKGVTRANCLGENCSEEEVKKYSVHTNVDEALTENNVKHKYVVYDDTCHGFGVGKGTCAEGWIDDMLKFFNENNKE